MAACLSAQAVPGVPPPHAQLPNSSQPNFILPLTQSQPMRMCACASGRLSNCVPPPSLQPYIDSIRSTYTSTLAACHVCVASEFQSACIYFLA